LATTESQLRPMLRTAEFCISVAASAFAFLRKYIKIIKTLNCTILNQ